MLFSLKTLRFASLAVCLLSPTLAFAAPDDMTKAGESATSAPKNSADALPAENLSEETAPSETAQVEEAQTPTYTAIELGMTRVIENYRSAIEQKESEVGPYNEELSEMIFGLGLTLQNAHRYDEALHTYKRSLHLKRINNGVYSLSQAPVLRSVIDTYRQLGLINEEADTYGQLLWIHVKTYGENDPRLIPLLKEISQWHVTAYMRTGAREDGYHLAAAFDLYSMAIDLIAEHRGANSLEQIDLLKNLAITGYFNASHQLTYPEFSEIGASVPFGYRPFGTNHDNMLQRGSFYQHGQSTHVKIQKILNENPDTTPRDKAIAQTDLGDWYMLFGRYQSAISAYSEAHKIMANDQQKDEVLSALFDTPKMLPRLDDSGIGQSSSSDDSEEIPSDDANDPKKNSADLQKLPMIKPLRSFVNLTVDVTERGKPTNMAIIEVFPKSADTDSHSIRAKKTIRARKFRPRFEAGKPVITNAFPIRVFIPNENS